MNSFVLVCFWFVLATSVADGQECNEKGMRRLDQTVAKAIVIGGTGRKFPTNKDQMKKFCEETEDYVRQVDQYKTKCFKGLNKQVFGVLLYSIKSQVIKKMCRQQGKIKDLIDSAHCLNKHDPIITKCYTTMVDEIIGTKNADDKMKIPHLCCSSASFFKCMDTSLIKADGCSEKDVTVAGDIVRNIVQNVLDLVCGEYSEATDKCDSLGPPPKKRKNQRRTKSFAIPIIEVLASFPEV